MIKTAKEIYIDVKEHPEFIIIAFIYQGLFLLITKLLLDFIRNITINELILVDNQMMVNLDIFYAFISVNGVITIILILLAASLFLIQNFGLIFILSDIYTGKNISFLRAFKNSIKKLSIAIVANIIKLIILASIIIIPGFIIYLLYTKLQLTPFLITGLLITIFSICLFIYSYIRMIFLEQTLCLEKRKIKDIFNDYLTKRHFWKLFKIIILLTISLIVVGGIATWILITIKNISLQFLISQNISVSLFLTLWIVLAVTILPLIGIIYNSILVKVITILYFKSKKEKTHVNQITLTEISIKIKKFIKKYKFVLVIILIVYITSNMSVTYPIVNNGIDNLDKEVKISAHRGHSQIAPENTLAAFSKAIAAKTDFIELDVQQTRDGIVIVFHDRNLKRIAGIDKQVSELNYSELKNIDVGSYFSKEYKNERIPTLKQVINLTRNKTRLIIDIKPNGPNSNIEEKIVRIIKEENLITNCIVISTNYESLNKVKILNPNIKIGLIIGNLIGAYSNMDVDVYVISAPIVGTQSFMKNAQDKDKEIFVYPELNLWSINPLEDASKFIDYGVDNLIVDNPVKTKELIDKMNKRTTLEKINAKMSRYFS